MKQREPQSPATQYEKINLFIAPASHSSRVGQEFQFINCKMFDCVKKMFSDHDSVRYDGR